MILGSMINIMQLNIEGISKSKSLCLSKMLIENNVDVVLIQETHVSDLIQLQVRGEIEGFKLIGATYSQVYGIATYVKALYTRC